MKITLELFNELPEGATEHDVRIVLMDALAEYVSNRHHGNGQSYVAARYPGDGVYTGADRDRKIHSVNLRCKVADALHSHTVIIHPKDGE